MGISLKPTVSCNLQCTYCYENEIRSAGNAKAASAYDKDAMMKTAIKELKRTKHPLILHGGEPLLMDIEDISDFFKLSYELTGSAAIQTNGELITDEHIELFLKYKVGVGVSIDGFGELNLGRWKGTREKTLEYTAKVWETMKKMKERGVNVGIIAIISRKNGLPEQRQQFKDFCLELKKHGIEGARLNPVHVDDPSVKDEFELTNAELTDFYTDIGKFVAENGLAYQPFRDITDSLLNLGLGTCVFDKCDWYHTLAEQGVQPDGSMGGCLKIAKDGVIFLQDEYGVSDERYQILKQIPMSEGGCGGCRFWTVCGGVCPAEGMDDDEGGDWRSKSRYCETYYALYEQAENQLKSLLPNIVLATEQMEGETQQDKYVVDKNRAWGRILNDGSSWTNRNRKIEIPKPQETNDEISKPKPAMPTFNLGNLLKGKSMVVQVKNSEGEK